MVCCGVVQTMSNIVSSLVAANPEALGGAALAAALGALRAPDLLRVTRDEYFVFLTPPGDLYDKTVVPGYHPHSLSSFIPYIVMLK